MHKFVILIALVQSFFNVDIVCMCFILSSFSTLSYFRNVSEIVNVKGTVKTATNNLESMQNEQLNIRRDSNQTYNSKNNCIALFANTMLNCE